MLSPVPNLFLFRKVLIREHLGERRGEGALKAERQRQRRRRRRRGVGIWRPQLSYPNHEYITELCVFIFNLSL